MFYSTLIVNIERVTVEINFQICTIVLYEILWFVFFKKKKEKFNSVFLWLQDFINILTVLFYIINKQKCFTFLGNTYIILSLNRLVGLRASSPTLAK